ncbi:Glutathione S-transferase protein [Aphelenchoides bicaudatus]|nr:Glutathione S-transferase protein [Aphelenchoides bicaudatus]
MNFFSRNDRAPSSMRRTSTPATFQSMPQQQNSYQYQGNMNNNAYASTMMLAPSANYKIYYFPLRNTAEASRMILAYAGVPFEDIRITANEWPKWKSKMPQQALPVLVVDGKRLSQSTAIASFLGHRFGLAGRSDWEQARVDEAVQTYRDFYEAIHDYLLILGGFKQGNVVRTIIFDWPKNFNINTQIVELFGKRLCKPKSFLFFFAPPINNSSEKDVFKSTVEPAAERYLPLFTHMLDRHNYQFIAGNRETYADFIISDFLFSLQGLASKLFDKRRDLQDYVRRVQSLPQLQQYLRSRPKTAF